MPAPVPTPPVVLGTQARFVDGEHVIIRGSFDRRDWHGFMAWITSVPLDPSTVMIGSIALGLVVDDTVHFLARLRPLAASGMPMEEAIAGAMHATARPLIVTSIVLVAGFSAMILASFTPNIYFGVVASVVIILALIADLIALPAMLVLIRPKI